MNKKMKRSDRGDREASLRSMVKMAKRLRLDLRRFGGFGDHMNDDWDNPLADMVRILYKRRFGSNGL